MTPSQFVSLLRKKKLLLPPISGYTDYPYRSILAHFSPPFMITEMAHARAVTERNTKTMEILTKVEGRHKHGVQLFGSDPVVMAEAATVVEELGFDYIDINMGCTVRKVASRGAGVSLMADEERASTIVSAITDAVALPVTCKLRLGVSRQKINVISFSKKMAEAGAVALTIHGRSGEKKFGTPLDIKMIKDVAETVSVPIVANGGIYTGTDAYTMVEKTGAAAVMPGRGLIGNPWLIPEILYTFSSARPTPPSLQEKKDVCLQHLDQLTDFYGERSGVLKMRSILPHYFSSCRFLKQLKTESHTVKNPLDISLLLDCIRETPQGIIYKK